MDVLKHWQTGLCGLGIIGCTVGSIFFPPIAPFCPLLGSLFTGTGLILAADASKFSDAGKLAAEATKKILVLLILSVSGLAVVSACSSVQIQKAQSVIATISADGKTVVVKGCEALPVAEVAASLVAEFYPASASSITLGEGYAQKLCAKVLAIQATK